MSSRLSFSAALLVLAAPVALAQSFPSKPIRVIVGFVPGGPTDITARMISQKLSESWGQPIIIENRAGATTQIAGQMVANSPPDGYTLLASASTQSLLPSLFPKMSYDPMKDFKPITVIFSAPFLLTVSRTLPVKRISDVVKLAKARPGELSYASAGLGSASQLTFELFRVNTGTNMNHVPYKGQGQALADLVAGEVQLMFNSLGAVSGFLTEGRLRAIGVTSAKRLPSLPDVPTFAESNVPDMVTGSWYGFWAPARTPDDIANQLNKEMVRITQTPEIRKQIFDMGGVPIGNSRAEFEAFQEADRARWARVIKEAGIKLQ